MSARRTRGTDEGNRLTDAGEGLKVLTHDNRVVTLTPLAFGGHCLYCRKVKMGEQDAEKHLRRVGNIVVPGRALDNAAHVKFVFAEVRAKGPRCGMPCTKAHMTEHKRCRCMSDCYRVGDMVLLPFYSPSVKDSPFAEDEWFIEESVPLAIFTPE